MAYKVYLSPSDQRRNTYAYGNTTEDVQCGKVATACSVALKRCGIDVKIGQYATMAVRCAESDAFGADLHVPIHSNAFNGKVGGTRIMCYKFGSKGHEACKSIFNRLAPLTPGDSENISEHPELYEIKNPKAPTAYIETDFHDVPSIAQWIIENTTLIGETIAHGICDYFGVKFVEPETVKTDDTPSNVIYRVQVGAYSVRANAERMLDTLKKAGIDGFIVTNKI